jgi:hypothetical protein
MTRWVKLTDDERRSTRLLRPRDVAVQYGLTTAVQSEWRHAGTGPPLTRIGHRWYVRRDLLEAWLDAHTDSQTADIEPQPAETDPPQPCGVARGP